jgi:hypothetical protein
MIFPFFNDVQDEHDFHAVDCGKLLDAYNMDEGVDEEELLDEPSEAFHSIFYKLAGLDVKGEAVFGTESFFGAESSSEEESGDGSGEESDSEEDESGHSEYGDEEIDKASLVDDDAEREEWDEHDYSDAGLDAEESVSVASIDEEVKLEGEEGRDGKYLHY